MINTRDMNPRVMTYKSRDFQLILKHLDLVMNSLELDIEYFPNLINPDKCKPEWLRYMASLVGYKYDESLTADQNRYMIANYKPLLRLRGSKAGVELAVAIYLKLIGRDDTNFRVNIPTVTSGDLVEGTIYIDDELLDISLVPLLSKLLDLVRPVGVNYVVRKSVNQNYQSNINPKNMFEIYQMKYPKDITTTEPERGYGKNYPDDNDRSEAHTGYMHSDDPSGIQTALPPDETSFDIEENPDNMVGHTIVDGGTEVDNGTTDTNKR